MGMVFIEKIITHFNSYATPEQILVSFTEPIKLNYD